MIKSTMMILAMLVMGTMCRDTLHFVYELSRHGARAPTSEQATGYSIGPGMLTPEGMRQRYLLGAYNRKRYTEEYQLLSKDQLDYDEVMMMSTLVNRTIQSGYSELMGLYQPSKATATKLTKAQLKSMEGGVGATPFNVRDSAQLNEQLGEYALPHGVMQVPIYNMMEKNENDDLDLPGCEYVNKIDGARFPSDSTYDEVYYLVDDLRGPLQQCFELSDEEA